MKGGLKKQRHPRKGGDSVSHGGQRHWNAEGKLNTHKINLEAPGGKRPKKRLEKERFAEKCDPDGVDVETGGVDIPRW